MESLEIKAALESIKEQVNVKAGENSVELKGLIDALELKMQEKHNQEINGLKADLKAIQDHADKLDLKLQEKKQEENAPKDALVKAINDNVEAIKNVRKGAGLEVKAVANMTTANLTGTAPRTYNFDIVTLPAQMVNIEDLVGIVTAENGIYTFTRETGSEGAFALQTEGAAKGQIDYDFTAIDVATNFIAGFTRYSRKMRNNLGYIVNTIPKLLRRDYYKAENATFQTVLAAAATASTEVITGSSKIEMLINEIGKLQNADYNETNLIVVKPSDYLDILKTAKQDLASAVTYENGILRVAGVQVLKASSWLPDNKYYVGDWSRVNKVVTEGLSLAFSDEEGTNFVNNNITARLEAQVALAIEQPAAIIYGDFTAA